MSCASCPAADNSAEPLTPADSESARNMRTLRRLDRRRRLDITAIDAESRNQAVKLLLQVSGGLRFSNDITFLAVRVLDSALAANQDFAKQMDLSVATAILMAAKLEDFKRQEHAREIASRFPDIEPDVLVTNEIELFRAIEYDMYFVTPNRFLWHFVRDESQDVARIADSLCFCAALKLECARHLAEDVARACLTIAKKVVNDGIKIEDVQASNDAEKDVLAAAEGFQSQAGASVFEPSQNGEKQ